ncbi:hypothetical protein GS436_02845 [Rhodococcus hoagii]|uniref:Uncharacterized protein n=1 Tax=Rhodococcus hoagii TaxID=43767 RepID=A0AAE2W4F0_RHOHA|nr:hypothetical protein [Prescottella equi]MBM4713647.1 hypothetical protein [Prescottella equi]NKR61718.1 hypothetical protein [Prescottella equi]NKS11969.1 hypothetical protein [Prescottella equi]
MPTMKPLRKDGWTPTQLVAPDGRTYTPGSYREHRQLLASGYVEAPQEQPAATPADVLAGPPEDDTTAGVATEPPADTEPAPAAPEAATKTKTTRRNGGQQ